jgi:trimeric autotransporter adhesin
MTNTARIVLVCFLVACGDSTGPGDRAPTLDAVSPAAIPSGSGDVTILVTGHGFVAESRIRIDGVERATTVTGPGEVRTQLAAAELVSSKTMSVVVANPGDRLSNALPLLVTNPAPLLDAVVPPSLTVGDTTRSVVVLGRSFRPNSTVRWNGVDRPTRYISDARLEADITSADVALGARVRLSVHSPAPEGGAAEIEYLVNNRQPRISGLSPEGVPLDAAATTLIVTGENFVPGATIRWNGSSRATTYYGPDRLSFLITGADLTTVGGVAISVVNPDPAIAVSNDSTFWIRPSTKHVIDLIADDLAWDPVRNRLYASVEASDARYPNEVVALDPLTGEVVAHVSPGLGPGQLAIADDASVLYVTLNGEAAVARIDLSTFTRNLRFELGTGAFGTLYAGDIEVMPGAPSTVAIARAYLDVSPHQEGVALYDNGVPRPVATARVQGGNLIEFTSPTMLFGYNSETSGFQLFRMDVSDSGLVVRDARVGLVDEYYADIRAGGGYVCSTGGTVIDATTGWLAARTGVQGLVFPESDGSRIYYITHTTLYAVSSATWSLMGTESVSALPPSWYSFTRWGSDGFAFIGPTQVVTFRSDLATRPPVP